MARVDVDPFQTDGSGRRTLLSFSVAERDHRYARMRHLMAEQELDCLLVPFSEVGETQANSRYLCQIGGVQGGAWVVFPATGEATAVVMAEREQAMWQANLAWPSDIRWGSFSKVVPERVRELELHKSRIGVAGLVGQQARPEGIIPHETWQRITAALPDATFVPATEVLDLARVVKGAEEVAVIQRITDANEAAIERMKEVSAPGVEEATVWMAMAEVLIRHSADYPARLSLGSNDRSANASNTMGLPIAMEDGGVLSQEVDARVQGYRAQSNHSILIGREKADAYREAMNASIEVFSSLVQWLRPGITVGEFGEEATRLAQQRKVRLGAGPVMHTNGLGSDRPRYGPRGSVQSSGGGGLQDHEMVIEAGWTFTIKTHVVVPTTGTGAMVGDPVTVTEEGARRLGHRSLEPFITG